MQRDDQDWSHRRKDIEEPFNEPDSGRAPPPDRAEVEGRDGSSDWERPEGWELFQSPSGIWTAVLIIFTLDSLALVYGILSDAGAIGSLVVDVFFGINLLRGKAWARTWMIFRLMVGALVFSGIAIAQEDAAVVALTFGAPLAVIRLLTGGSTGGRFVGGTGLLIMAVVTWIVLPSDIDLIPDRAASEELASAPARSTAPSNPTPTQAPAQAMVAPTPTPILGESFVPVPTPVPISLTIPMIRFRVIDAEYSKQLDRIVMVSSEPNQLHIYDPVTAEDMAVDLPLTPAAVSVSPDGRYAAVGHDAWISESWLG